MDADNEKRPSGNWGARESGASRGDAWAALNPAARATQARDIVIHIPPGAWEALEREQAREREIARLGLRLLGPERARDFKQVLTVGRVLFGISPDLLPDWTAWASAHPHFTPERCRKYFVQFPMMKGFVPRLGLVMLWVRADTGDDSFGKGRRSL